MNYSTENIRNVVIMGHSSNGKSSLVESMLYMTGATDRLGKVTEGNTVSDYDPEEIKRKISVSASTVYVDYNDRKINIIDTPGFFDFAGEVMQALRVADAGIIVCSAKEGLNVGAEKAWRQMDMRDLPRAVYVSKIDEEHGDYNAVLAQFREKYGPAVVPIIAPCHDADGNILGIVDLIGKKAYTADGGKTRTEIPIPECMSDELNKLYEAVNESVAETSEEFMDRYFNGEAFTIEEIVTALRKAVREHELYPVFCGSAMNGYGTLQLLTGIVNLFPSPLDAEPEKTEDGDELALDVNGAPCALVYKTISDQYGKMSCFKVVSGNITGDTVLYNVRTGEQEKLGRINMLQGKKLVEVKQLVCGDLGAVSKLASVKTGDTLSASKDAPALAGISKIVPSYAMAIAPKTKGQDDKVASGLARLSEEDISFTYAMNPETKQMVLTANGDIQLDVICSRLKSRFGVEVELSPAKVAYREKIRKKVEVQGRHKKQSGGHGQFGDVWIRFEPQDESEELVFAEEVFGGSVPKNFFPAVEKGLRECAAKGVLAGYPMVGLKATLYDGSYHPVDSSEMAFKTAASVAYKAGIPIASPVILEPIGYLTVTVPDAYLGDIMSDLSKRRGSPMGMSVDKDGNQIVEAEVPMGEMTSYLIDLRSMTQGRGSYQFKFTRYEEAPPAVQSKIIEEAQKDAE
ncbi:MAG: elongation factor G [Oscillospiraceae bacterium]|nr:elongation factor G [Oscillospiraceae bacterium]